MKGARIVRNRSHQLGNITSPNITSIEQPKQNQEYDEGGMESIHSPYQTALIHPLRRSASREARKPPSRTKGEIREKYQPMPVTDRSLKRSLRKKPCRNMFIHADLTNAMKRELHPPCDSHM